MNVDWDSTLSSIWSNLRNERSSRTLSGTSAQIAVSGFTLVMIPLDWWKLWTIMLQLSIIESTLNPKEQTLNLIKRQCLPTPNRKAIQMKTTGRKSNGEWTLGYGVSRETWPKSQVCRTYFLLTSPTSLTLTTQTSTWSSEKQGLSTFTWTSQMTW